MQGGPGKLKHATRIGRGACCKGRTPLERRGIGYHRSSRRHRTKREELARCLVPDYVRGQDWLQGVSRSSKTRWVVLALVAGPLRIAEEMQVPARTPGPPIDKWPT